MWLRLIGAGILLLCGRSWARELSREERMRARQVMALGELFARMGEQIEALCLPLDEILANVPPSLLADCGCTGGDADGPAGMLALGAAKVRDSRARETLDHAVAGLGRGSREDQIRLCRGTAEALIKRGGELSADAARGARARETLFLTAGLLVSILLW